MHYKSETHQHLRQFQVTHPRDVTSPGNEDNTLLLISENILQRVKLCYSLSHNKLIQFYTTRITVQTILNTILASHLINYFAQFSPSPSFSPSATFTMQSVLTFPQTWIDFVTIKFKIFFKGLEVVRLKFSTHESDKKVKNIHFVLLKAIKIYFSGFTS